MRLGLIDIGTNSVRLDIYQLYPNGKQERLQRKKVMVRLGQDVFLSGTLHPEGIKRTLNALTGFSSLCEELAVDEIRAIATSAVRQASNAEEFITRCREETGISIATISGREEAELILAGIRQDWRSAAGNFAFIDIGGGSTEIGVLRDDKIISLESLSIGAARIHQLCFNDKAAEGVPHARKTIMRALHSTFNGITLGEIPLLLGSSGTIKALQTIFHTAGKGSTIRLELLSTLIAELASLSLKERKNYPGLHPKRADIIVPGAIILEETMKYLNTNTIHYTKYALRDGLLVSALRESLST